MPDERTREVITTVTDATMDHWESIAQITGMDFSGVQRMALSLTAELLTWQHQGGRIVLTKGWRLWRRERLRFL